MRMIFRQMLCFEHNKHVVVEKPIALNFKDAKEMVDTARAKKLFFMEGMWTRFFPAVRAVWMRVCVMGCVTFDRRGGTLRVATLGTCGLCRPTSGSKQRRRQPAGSICHRVAAPSSTLVLASSRVICCFIWGGIYTVAAAYLGFGDAGVSKVGAVGRLAPGGADITAAVTLHFKDKGVANVTYSIEVRTCICRDDFHFHRLACRRRRHTLAPRDPCG